MDVLPANDFYYLGLIVLLPLIGGIINGLFGSRLNSKLVDYIGVGAVFGSFMLAMTSVAAMWGGHGLIDIEAGSEATLTYTAFQWIYSGGLGIDIAFMLDSLSAVMILVVTGVGFLIHLYSTGYMADDPGKWKYFSYLNLFIFAMLLLVLGKNMIVTFIGWEGVGACSYLLIGFWYTDDEKAKAGQKAFIVNRVGDFAFIVGLFLIFWEAGTFDYIELEQIATNASSAGRLVQVALPAVLLIFVGCTGKSAQIPLYTWLPDAMAGPTPVSALIHAATMVTSGVYLLARLNYLVTLTWKGMMVIALIGAFTAFIAATIAMVQNDIKKVLAYSTVSQLGYMFVGIGSGMFVGAIFHLMTHAFFKALLFLGSGSVIHSMGGDQDIRNMGGLKKWMPVTHWTFLLACLAIAGVPMFAGFFSKDLILWGALSNVHVFQIGGVEQTLGALTTTAAPAIASGGEVAVETPWAVGFGIVYALGLVTAGLTAFYMFRLYFLTFQGECRADDETKSHLHESPMTMTIPLVVLGILAVIGGYTGFPHPVAAADWMLAFEHWLEPVFAISDELRVTGRWGDHATTYEWIGIGASVAVAGLGIFTAWFAYMRSPGFVQWVYERAQLLYKVLDAKYYVDEAYDFLFVRGSIVVGKAWYAFDRAVVDGIVNAVGFVAESAGNILKNLQSGDMQRYATYIVLAVVLAMLALI